jgi:hypothetical protein
MTKNVPATYDFGAPTAVVQQQSTMQNQAVDRLAEWADAAIAAHQVAESLVKTSFVPEAFRGKAHEATAAILSGSEVGLSPMASLRSFDIINGVAAPRALTLRAIVQSQGHRIWTHESTATRAIVKGIRRGDNREQMSRWDMDRADALGLKSKDNWKRQPQAMLVARATSELARMIAADAILGIGYTVEELQDEKAGIVELAEPDAPAPATQRMSRPRKTAPAEGVDVPAIGPAQVTKIHVGFSELGIEDRDDRLAYSSRVLGKRVASHKDLTVAQGSRIIEQIESDKAGGPPPDEEKLQLLLNEEGDAAENWNGPER